MTAKDRLRHLIDEMPESKAEEVERVVMQMLRTSEQSAQEEVSFEDAMDYTFTHFDKALRNLAK